MFLYLSCFYYELCDPPPQLLYSNSNTFESTDCEPVFNTNLKYLVVPHCCVFKVIGDAHPDVAETQGPVGVVLCCAVIELHDNVDLVKFTLVESFPHSTCTVNSYSWCSAT